MVSSLASYGGRLARNGANYSLGASGAAWACVAAFTMHYPGGPAKLIFLPGVNFEVGLLVPVLMGADALGVLKNWQHWDHHRHLGGALFGKLYTISGHHLWDRRDKVLHAMGLAGDDIEDLKFP
ncbi:g8837 [Coccomyxa viridis]|uniref:G8837 protein n=1 Tax=Coccomyxa viridis TaxID=1274662 RepID=A0ABP1G7Q1_9CHLO